MSIDDTIQNIPQVSWPDETGSYKVAQLTVDGRPFLIFGSKEEYHGDILRNFLTKHGISFEIMRSKDGMMVPCLEGTRYKVLGMGRSYVSPESKIAILGGDSYDYKIEIDPAHLDSIKPFALDWKLEVS